MGVGHEARFFEEQIERIRSINHWVQGSDEWKILCLTEITQEIMRTPGTYRVEILLDEIVKSVRSKGKAKGKGWTLPN